MKKTKSPARPVIKVRGISDLLNLIPSLLGFHPSESVVVVCFEHGRVAVTARVDLWALYSSEVAREQLDAIWQRFPGAFCVAVAYSADVDGAWAALDLIEAALEADTPFEAAVVSGGRWYGCRDEEGSRYEPQASAQAAEAAYHGLRVLPDRESVAAQLEPVLDEAVMQAALERVIEAPPAQSVASAFALATEVMRTPRALTPDEAASLAVAAFSPSFSEAVVTGIDRSTAEAARSLWTDVVRSTPEFAGAAAATILGMGAWITGDGAVMNLCLERAASYVGDSQWFRFLELASRIALPPSQWDAVRRELLRACEAA